MNPAPTLNALPPSLSPPSKLSLTIQSPKNSQSPTTHRHHCQLPPTAPEPHNGPRAPLRRTFPGQRMPNTALSPKMHDQEHCIHAPHPQEPTPRPGLQALAQSPSPPSCSKSLIAWHDPNPSRSPPNLHNGIRNPTHHDTTSQICETLQISSRPPPSPQPPQTVLNPSDSRAPKAPETPCADIPHIGPLSSQAVPWFQPFSPPSKPFTQVPTHSPSPHHRPQSHPERSSSSLPHLMWFLLGA